MTALSLTLPRHTPDAHPRPRPAPAGFVLYVDLGPEAFAAMPAEVLRAAETLRELASEWLPEARTRTVLAAGGRPTPPTPRHHPDRSLRAALAAIPDLPDVEVDLRARRVTVGQEELHLTPKEFDLLAHLARAAGRVVTREELRATVWRGRSVAASSRTVDVHVRRLRAIPALSGLIATAHGVGYRMPPRPHLRVVT